jgi:hypothetical protein
MKKMKIKYTESLLGLTVTVMQSCFIAKDYKRPELKTADLYRNEVVSTDTTSLAIWLGIKFYRFSLQGYISKGLQNNLDIRIAMQNIVAAQLL